jgi:hypothetical protein
MAMSNAERQARWREKRNTLAKLGATMPPRRGRRPNRAHIESDAVNDFLGELLELKCNYSSRLRQWLHRKPAISKADCEFLTQQIHLCANELTELAQLVDEHAQQIPKPANKPRAAQPFVGSPGIGPGQNRTSGPR